MRQNLMHDNRDIGAASKSRVPLCLALLLLVLAVVVRMWRLDLMLYEIDEGIASIYALQLIGHGIIPTVGVKTSLGFYNPPLFIFIVSLPFWCSPSPVIACGFLQLLFVSSLALLVWVLWKRGWRWRVVFLLVLAGLAPGPLLSTHRLWGHTLIPAFSIVAFVCVLALASGRRVRLASTVLPLAICCAQQVHFSGSLLLVSAGLTLAILRVRPRWKWIALGCLLALLSMAPYYVHLVETRFADVRIVFNLMFKGAGGGGYRRPLYMAAIFSLSDLGANAAFEGTYAGFLRMYPLLRLLQAGGVFVLLLGLLRAARLAFRVRAGDADAQVAVAALAWTLVPLLAFTVLKVESVPAYWLVALPGPWLLACLAWPAARSWPLRAVYAVGAVAYAVLCVYHLFAYYRAVDAADPALLKYAPYRNQKNAIEYLCADSVGRQPLLKQDARTEHGGIDYSLAYLITIREGGFKRFTPEAARPGDGMYLIHNLARPLHPEIEQEWDGSSVKRFGLLEVRALPPTQVRKWGIRLPTR